MDKNLKEIIERTKAYGREIKIEKIFSDDEVKTPNQKFIDEIRDHFSTCINRNDFINRSYFINPSDMANIPTCNCHTHLESKEAFKEFLKVTYSMYREKEDFNIYLILNEKIINEL